MLSYFYRCRNWTTKGWTKCSGWFNQFLWEPGCKPIQSNTRICALNRYVLLQSGWLIYCLSICFHVSRLKYQMTKEEWVAPGIQLIMTLWRCGKAIETGQTDCGKPHSDIFLCDLKLFTECTRDLVFLSVKCM